MKNKQLVLYKGQAFSSIGLGRFAKGVVKEGRYVHPRTGQEVIFDAARIQRLADNTNEYLKNETKVPFPDGHSFKAQDNLGYWPGPFIRYKDELVGIVEPAADKTAEKMKDGSIDAVSAYIEFDVRDSKGKHYDEVITHVCATPYPVITGQKGFIELARTDAGDVYVPAEALSTKGDTSMDLAKLKAALKLKADAKDEEVLEAAIAKLATGEAGATAATTLSAVAEGLKAHGLKLDGEKVVKLDVQPPAGETPREKDLRERLEKSESDTAKLRLSSIKAEVEGYVKAGRIPPAMQEKVEKMLSLAGKTEHLALSSDGRAVTNAFDALSTLKEILNGLPQSLANSEGFQRVAGATGGGADIKKEDTEEAKTLANKVQGTQKKQ